MVQVPDDPRGNVWEFSCECGRSHSTKLFSVIRGKTRSCGCLSREVASARSRTHGATAGGKRKPEYSIWRSVVHRCTSPDSPHWPRYGGRGIDICSRWRTSFQAFFDDMGQRPLGLTLERVDNDKGYSPDNCVWATRKQQANNTSRTLFVVHRSETRSLQEWSALTGVKANTIRKRLREGWPVGRALFETATVFRKLNAQTEAYRRRPTIHPSRKKSPALVLRTYADLDDATVRSDGHG